jgi:hypothetical protein
MDALCVFIFMQIRSKSKNVCEYRFLEFDSGPDGESPDDTSDGESAEEAKPRSPQGGS